MKVKVKLKVKVKMKVKVKVKVEVEVEVKVTEERSAEKISESFRYLEFSVDSTRDRLHF